MLQHQRSKTFYHALFILAALSVSLLWSVSAYAQDEGKGTVCVLQVFATGEVMAVIVDDYQDIDIAVAVPKDNVTNLPIRCQDIARLGVAAANQESFKVSLTTIIFDNQGKMICTKGPFSLPQNGGQGVSFKDCI
jgi:hypothetical protein